MATATALAAKAAYQAKRSSEVNKHTQEYARRSSLNWVVSFQAASRSLDFEALDESNQDSLVDRLKNFLQLNESENDWITTTAQQLKHSVVKTVWFEAGVTFCILMVGIAMGVEATYIHSEEGECPTWVPTLTEFVSTSTLLVFTVEALLKIASFGRFPFQYWLDTADGAWNTFDFLVVLLSWIFGGGNSGGFIAVLRLCRLLRLLNMLGPLRVILKGLFAGLRSVCNIMVLLVLTVYMFSVLGVTLFGRNDPVHFKSVMIGMLTLFRCATLAGWAEVYFINYYGCDVYTGGIYATMMENNTNADLADFSTSAGTFPQFLCVDQAPYPVTITWFMFLYSIITAFVVISLFVGVITMGMFDAIEVEKQISISDNYNKELAAKTRTLTDPSQNSFLKHRLDQAFGHHRVEAQESDSTDSVHGKKKVPALQLPDWCVAVFCTSA